VLGDSIVRNVGAGKSDMRIVCFPGIRVDQLQRVMENRGIGHSDAVVIHVGTNDVRIPRKLDFIMGEVYELVNTAKAKYPGYRLVLSCVLRGKCVNWRRVGAANDRLEWVARTLGATFVDQNSWIRDEDFGEDGLHLNRHGAMQLGDLCSRVCGLNN
jgi:lysophospholipase L1-like esterase